MNPPNTKDYITKNKIKTAGYFMKRLRDNGFITLKIFAFYAKSDPRRWTVLVNPGEASVFITCMQNKTALDEILFEFNDGGRHIPKNFAIKTDSIEVIIEYLLNHGVTNNGDYPGKSKFIADKVEISLNTRDEQAPKESEATKARS